MSYIDNSVPFGSRVEDILRGTGAGTPVGTYILESISLTRPSKIIERPNQIGEPNGWVAVAGFQHGTCVVQIPLDTSEYPKIGDWFEDTFDGSDASPSTEHWVIVDITQSYAMADYFKCNATIRLSINPPA